MKRFTMLILLILAVGTATVYAKTGGWQESQNVNKYILELTIQNNPPKVGINPITVVVRDTAGTTVTDAKVFIEYDMPGMHHNEKESLNAGMFTTDLVSKSGKYRGKLNFIMPGEWVVYLKTVRSGMVYTATYKVNVK